MFYNIGMKKEEDAKIYPFKFSPLMIGVFSLAILLCAVCFGLSLWRFLNFLQTDISSPYGWIQYILLFFVSVFLAVLVIAMLIRARYIITDKQLITQFGLVRQKYEIKNIYSIHLFQGMGKLAVYFDDFKTKYIIIAVKDCWYDDFVQTLLSKKPGLSFSFSSAEEEEEIKKKK